MAEKMQAAVYRGPNDIRVEDVDIPAIASSEVLLKVTRTGICGTDIRIMHGVHRKYPTGTIRIPGHELVGEVVEAGRDLKDFYVGQRLFIAPNMGCGHCRQCVSGNNNLCANYDAFGITIDGSFAQYMRIPTAAVMQGNLIPVPEDLNPAVAALIEPFACVLRGQEAVKIQPGETVLVIGAGPIGCMHVMLARLRGAGKVFVSELIPERREQVARMGADRILDPSTENIFDMIADETQEKGVDIVIVAAPAHKAQETALELSAIGGRINFFGGLPNDQPSINFNSNLVHYKELIVTGTTACSTNDNRKAVEIVSSGRINLESLIGASFPLREVRQALATAEDGTTLKVVLDPWA